MPAVQESPFLQLAGEASLQNEVGHNANATDQSNRLVQNNDVESSSEPIAKADFDISGEEMKRATVIDSDLRMSRRLKRGKNKENRKAEKPWRIGAVTEADDRAARNVKQKTSGKTRPKDEVQKEPLELQREQEAFEKGNLPQAQPHRRRSRTDCKIAALQRAKRCGGRAKSSVSQHAFSPNQSFSTATPSETPGLGYPAPSHPQNRQPLPHAQATSIAQSNTQLTPAPQLRPSPVPSSSSSYTPSLVAICYDCNVRTTDFPDSPYVLPTSCPTCQGPLIYRPFTAVKRISRSCHLPLDQRAAARAVLESNFGSNPRLSTESGRIVTGEEPKQEEGWGRKRRCTGAGKTSAKVAKMGLGGEKGKELAAVRIDSDETEDEDEVVFIREVTPYEIE